MRPQFRRGWPNRLLWRSLRPCTPLGSESSSKQRASNSLICYLCASSSSSLLLSALSGQFVWWVLSKRISPCLANESFVGLNWPPVGRFLRSGCCEVKPRTGIRDNCHRCLQEIVRFWMGLTLIWLHVFKVIWVNSLFPCGHFLFIRSNPHFTCN